MVPSVISYEKVAAEVARRERRGDPVPRSSLGCAEGSAACPLKASAAEAAEAAEAELDPKLSTSSVMVWTKRTSCQDPERTALAMAISQPTCISNGLHPRSNSIKLKESLKKRTKDIQRSAKEARHHLRIITYSLACQASAVCDVGLPVQGKPREENGQDAMFSACFL